MMAINAKQIHDANTRKGGAHAESAMIPTDVRDSDGWLMQHGSEFQPRGVPLTYTAWPWIGGQEHATASIELDKPLIPLRNQITSPANNGLKVSGLA